MRINIQEIMHNIPILKERRDLLKIHFSDVVRVDRTLRPYHEESHGTVFTNTIKLQDSGMLKFSPHTCLAKKTLQIPLQSNMKQKGS